jgi:hypothetical protein
VILAGLRGVVVRAKRRAILPRRGGGPAIFLSYPRKRAWVALAVAQALALGCTTAAGREANSVASSQNDYDFVEARFADSCKASTPDCSVLKGALDTWLVDLHRRSFIAPGVARTGPTPLHDAALAADEKAALKAAAKVYP